MAVPTWPRRFARGPGHSFEGKVFTVVSCSTVSNDSVEALSATHPKPRDMLARRNSAFSAILGPDGAQPYGFASTT